MKKKKDLFKDDMKEASCTFYTEAEHTQNTKRGMCECDAQQTLTHQSHNHTLTINRGGKRKTSHGYIEYKLACIQHKHRVLPGCQIPTQVSAFKSRQLINQALNS